MTEGTGPATPAEPDNATLLETTIHKPSMTAGEVDMLLFAIDRSQAQFAWKCGGLDAAGLRKPHPPTAMTLGGLLKHLALVEDTYTARDLTGQPIGAPWDAVDFDADPEWEWRTAADDSPEDLYALWRGAVERSRTAVRRRSPTAGSTSRRSSPPAPASRPTSGAYWSTCTTSTPATSATSTSSARPSTAWRDRTRRSHDDGYADANPGRTADHRPC
jgi:hypothetical protein